MAALYLSTVRKEIFQVNGCFGAISDDNTIFGIDLKKRIGILLKRNRNLKKNRDFHFQRCKMFELQLDQLQKKYNELQNNFVASQILKQMDEYHKEILRLKDVVSNLEKERSQNLVQPFVNGEFTDLQTADVSIDIEEHEEEQIVKAEPQESEAEEEEEEALHPYNNSAECEVNPDEFEKRVEILNVRSANRQLRIHLCRVRPELYLQNGNSSQSESNLNFQVDDEPVVKGEFKFTDLQTANVSIGDREEQIVESDAEEGGEEMDNNSAEHEVNSTEIEERVEISTIPQEICPNNGNLDSSESNLVCKWIHHVKGVCHQEFLHASELESHLKTDHFVMAKGSRYTCRWEDCPRYGRPFVYPGMFISHLDKHVAQVLNEKQINQIQHETVTESNSSSENLCRSSPKKGQIGPQLKIHEGTHKGKDLFGCSYEGCDRKFATKQVLEYHLNWHRGEKPFKCPYDGCHWEFTDERNQRKHLRTHMGERPYKCTCKGCGCSFPRNHNLQVHLRIHNDERPYECTFPGCGMRFRQKVNQWAHFKRMHTKK